MKAYVKLVDGWAATVESKPGAPWPAVRVLVENVDANGLCFVLQPHVAHALAGALSRCADHVEGAAVVWLAEEGRP